MKTQDVSKKGMKFGDEDEDAAERKELNAQNIAFGPLINWLKRELKAQVSDGTSALPYFTSKRYLSPTLAPGYKPGFLLG
jgi:heat shock protein beta